jgi:hypothetical protein
MLLVFHLLGGQPARSTEVLSLRYRNIFHGRNVFVYDGVLLKITAYSKTQWKTGRSSLPSLKYLVFTHSYVFVSHAADEDGGLRTGVPGFRQLEEASKFAAVVWFESVGSQRLGFHR